MDAGGKIRTANILKRLKGGAFYTRLLMPATYAERDDWSSEIVALADETSFFEPESRNVAWRLRRAAAFFGANPISIESSNNGKARSAVKKELYQPADLIVFDYAQSIALAPHSVDTKTCFFAHNVETEILERHAATAVGFMKSVWGREAAKMRRFEARACKRVNGVIAVSERDADAFRVRFGAKRAFAIPTGVDLDYFSFRPPAIDAPPQLIFTGSMDWKANIDGLSWFMDSVWPKIIERKPDATFLVIGKNPPAPMIARAEKKGLNWRFTGFVDDIRDHAIGAAFIMPLRIGGGTRIKAFEAMAMGLPVVSTLIGVEGLPVRPDEHFLQADDPSLFAEAALLLIETPPLRLKIASNARRLVEEHYSHDVAARAFEQSCLAILGAVR